jgi:alpha-galactosidase/6-phospho-beta-glucosidase family protein
MKKTKYFTKGAYWRNSVEVCQEIVIERDEFITSHEIVEIESEDMKVEFVGNNHAVCILRLTYFEPT